MSLFKILKKESVNISRKEIIQELEEIIFMTMERAKALQYKSKRDVEKNPHQLRVSYLNSLAGLIKAYDQLLKSQEADEIIERLEVLENEYERK